MLAGAPAVCARKAPMLLMWRTRPRPGVIRVRLRQMRYCAIFWRPMIIFMMFAVPSPICRPMTSR
jgi:hypothetical protein